MAILIENIKDELSIRLYNVLKGRGIKMLEELTLASADDIHKWKNAGRKTSGELDKVMRRYKMMLGQYAGEKPSYQRNAIAHYRAFGPEFKKCNIHYSARHKNYARGMLVDSGPEEMHVYMEMTQGGKWVWKVWDNTRVLYASDYDNNYSVTFEDADADFCKFYMEMKELSKPRKRDRILDPLLEILEEEKPKPKSRRPTVWETIGPGRKRSRGSHVKVTEKDLLVQAAEFGDVPGIPHELAISKLVQKGQLKASASEPGAYVITAAGRKVLPAGNPRRRKKAKRKTPRKDPRVLEEIWDATRVRVAKPLKWTKVSSKKYRSDEYLPGYRIEIRSEVWAGTKRWFVYSVANKSEVRIGDHSIVKDAKAHGWAEAERVLLAEFGKIKETPHPLITKSRRMWNDYVGKPTKKRLKEFLAHVEKMEGATGKKIREEWRRAKRAARAEAKRLRMKV
jgi:hypothetical protein